MACATCPDPVIFSLRRKVEDELNKLARVIQLGGIFSDFLGQVAGIPFEDVNAAVNAIPNPIPLNPLDILAYITCPLTPLALALTDLDELLEGTIESQERRLRRLLSGTVSNARQAYELALTNTPNAKLIQACRRYQRELQRLRFDAESFAEAVVIVASVQAVCGDEEFLEGPYQRFAELANGFSFVGGVPGNLDQNLAALIQKLNEGEAKLAALQAVTQ